MRSLSHRLSRVARTLGCPIHGEPLSCPVCEAPAPLPEPLATGMHTLMEAIVGRVGQAGLRAAALRVTPPPVHAACPRCGGPRQCGTCGVNYTKRLLSAIGLSDSETADMQAMLALGRALEADAEKAQR